MKTYPKAVLSFITGPVRVETADNGQTILTHLQKYSHFGFMVTWPFCFHFWLFWQKQSQTAGTLLTLIKPTHEPLPGERWIEGSERGIYFRMPGWRWDYDLGMKWTWGYLGDHWD